MLRIGYDDSIGEGLEASGITVEGFGAGPGELCEALMGAWPDWVAVESSESGKVLAWGASNLSGDDQCQPEEGSFRHRATVFEGTFPAASDYSVTQQGG